MTHGKPPPLQRDKCGASCLRHLCVVPATCVLRREDGMGAPPPPHTPAPPRAGDAGRGGRKGPPPEDKAAGWGGSGVSLPDRPHDRARREHAPCKPQRGDHQGCERRVQRATTGATRHAPPPAEGQVPRLVPVPCFFRACDMRATKGRRQAPPPVTPPPPMAGG